MLRDDLRDCPRVVPGPAGRTGRPVPLPRAAERPAHAIAVRGERAAPAALTGAGNDLLELFKSVTDGSRAEPGHPVAALPALAAAAVMAGMKGYMAIAGWVKDAPPLVLADLYRRAGARPAPPPSRATIWRVITDADAGIFDATVGRSLMSRLGCRAGDGACGDDPAALVPVRPDGNTVRGARDAVQPAGLTAGREIGANRCRTPAPVSFPESAGCGVRTCNLSGGGLPGRLAAAGAGTLRLSLGLIGAGLKPGPGVLERRDLRFEPGPQLGLVPGGVLAGPVQFRAGRLGRLPGPGRSCPLPGPGLGRRHPFLGGPPDPGNLCPRGLGLLLGRPPSPPPPRPAAHRPAAPQHAPPRPQPRPARGAPRARIPGGPDPAARPHRDRAGPPAGAAGTRSGRCAARRTPDPAARSTPVRSLPPPAAAHCHSPDTRIWGDPVLVLTIGRLRSPLTSTA